MHVIECSSYQIDLAPSLDPSVGILINVTEDHIDRHGTLAHYAAVKERLVAGVPDNGSAIVGVDDNWCAATADRLEQGGKRVVRVSVRRPLSSGLYIDAEQIMQATRRNRSGDRASRRHRLAARRAQCAERRLRGRRRARARTDARRRSRTGCAPFPGSRTAWSRSGARAGCCSSMTPRRPTPDSTAQALACFEDIFWIAGGKPKTGGLSTLTGFFPRIRKAYLVGEAAAGFAAELEGHVPHVIAGTLDRAVALSARDAEAADLKEPVVLLSPACASFDQYRNFEVRGDAFRDLVLALPGLVPV